MSARTFLHVAPHPDDESIPAAATLLALVAAGHTVINYPCSFGNPDQVPRRRAEVTEACRRAGFELDREAPGFAISRGDDLEAAQRAIAADVEARVRDRGVDVVVAPTPHDGHPGHEVVGRAARDSVERCGEPAPRLWLWGLWADLPWPTLYSGFDAGRLDQVRHVLAAHVGELERNDYTGLVEGRARADRTLGSERVFGFGRAARAQPFAELLTEAVRRDGEWWAAGARELDPHDPLADAPPADVDPERARPHPLGWWLAAESFGSRMRRESRGAALG